MGLTVGRVLCVTLVACASGCMPPSGDGEAAAEGKPIGSDVVRGYLVLAEEARTLEPCGENRQLTVGTHPALEDAYARLGYGGSPIFVEVTGSPPPQAGSGAFEVRSLRRAAPAEEGFGCAEDVSGFAFRAAGVEPFWHVRVRPEGLSYTTPELPETLFEAAAPSRAGDGWVYEASSSGPEALTLRLELQPAPCTDSMVGAIYSWTASVEIAGEKLLGCAWEGALAPGA